MKIFLMLCIIQQIVITIYFLKTDGFELNSFMIYVVNPLFLLVVPFMLSVLAFSWKEFNIQYYSIEDKYYVSRQWQFRRWSKKIKDEDCNKFKIHGWVNGDIPKIITYKQFIKVLKEEN